jgi:hypothetical protein
VAVLALVLAACSGPVAVDVPTPEASALGACDQLAGAWPDTVLDQQPVAVEPSSRLTHAWGDPPITASCGVAAPTALQPDSQLVSADGVDWLPEKTNDGYRFTTVGRVANVEVSVPHHYAPEATALVDLAPAIKQTDPSPAPS